jgi:hypothetical protein
MDRHLPVDPRISLIVRIERRERGPMTGVVEHVGTGEKHRFAGVTEMGRIIEQIVAGEPPAGRRQEGRP